jgi:hypothetical protein
MGRGDLSEIRLLNEDVFSGKYTAKCIGHNVTGGAGEVLLDDVRQVGKGGSGRSQSVVQY